MLDKIKETALALAHEIGTQNVTHPILCDNLGISHGSFLHVSGGVTFTEIINELPLVGPSKCMNSRVAPKLRKQLIINTATELAITGHYLTLTQSMIAEAAHVSPSLVQRYFKTTGDLRNAVLTKAIEEGIVEIIAQILTSRDVRSKLIPRALKLQVARYIEGL